MHGQLRDKVDQPVTVELGDTGVDQSNKRSPFHLRPLNADVILRLTFSGFQANSTTTIKLRGNHA